MIYIDIIDALDHLSHNTTVTGIQRTQLELARHLAASKPLEAEFVIGASEGGLRVAQPDALQRLLDELDHARPERDSLASKLTVVRDTSVARTLTAADTFMATGMFWSSPATLGLMLRAKLNSTRVGFLCHDLIPITHKQYCPEQLTTLFERGLEAIRELADFAVTNSQHVQAELTGHLRRWPLDIPVTAIPLARDFTTGNKAAQPSADVAALAGRRFVLFLSTIEPRKNHALTLAVWEQLLARLSPETVPDLVWAGKHGFRSEEILVAARGSATLKGKIHILASVSDADVRILLHSCWCTIFPSHVEGWGLPVAESLAFGKPCLASGTSSIPEAGGSLAWYFDPNDVDEATQLVLSLIEEPQRVADRAEEIQRRFQRRPWSEVADAFVTEVTRLATASQSRPLTEALRLRLGHAYTACSLLERPPLNLNETFVRQTMFSEGWFAAEPWGRWLKQPAGTILLHLPSFDEARTCQV